MLDNLTLSWTTGLIICGIKVSSPSALGFSLSLSTSSTSASVIAGNVAYRITVLPNDSRVRIDHICSYPLLQFKPWSDRTGFQEIWVS